jgi:hypothetical protein
MIAAAAATNDRRATLIAMRDKLAADMDEAPPAVVAQIAGRLSAILVELSEMAAPGKVSSLDELDKRRQDRIATPTDSEPARRATRQRRA